MLDRTRDPLFRVDQGAVKVYENGGHGFPWGSGCLIDVLASVTFDSQYERKPACDNFPRGIQRFFPNKNPAGVRAICSDCHVPHDWGSKVVRKIQASGELWAKFMGKID
ncbi:MAG: NapC/NirT family cytochrome c, partial [Paracoccaceae bacterium]|nr:NapC/NirT family cytochrome c [Paracoccaceae bacterium]